MWRWGVALVSPNVRANRALTAGRQARRTDDNQGRPAAWRPAVGAPLERGVRPRRHELLAVARLVERSTVAAAPRLRPSRPRQNLPRIFRRPGPSPGHPKQAQRCGQLSRFSGSSASSAARLPGVECCPPLNRVATWLKGGSNGVANDGSLGAGPMCQARP
jgi:hypothetical protein